jgi:hypothetical protein
MATVTQLVNAKSRTVVTASARFDAALRPRTRYRISADVDFWYKFDDDDGSVAASADGAVWVAGGESNHYDAPPEGKVYLHVIRAAGVDGVANVAEAVEVEAA